MRLLLTSFTNGCVRNCEERPTVWWPNATVNSSPFGRCNSTFVSSLSHLGYRALQEPNGGQISTTREYSRSPSINKCYNYWCSSEILCY